MGRSTVVLVLCAMASLAMADGLDKGTLRAGATRIDITPEPGSSLLMAGYASRKDGFEGVHDPLFVRAIFVDDGSAQAAIVTLDLIGISHELFGIFSGRLTSATGIPAERILIAPTHTHGGPDIRKFVDRPADDPGRRYLDGLTEKIVGAVKSAQSAAQPARIGYGEGTANVNMNRRARMPEGDWWLGHNPDGPSDKTVGVLKIESSGGQPIALLINYAVHGTVLGGRNYQITADLPGACSRFVERHFDDKIVAAFTAGASGDQNPIYRTGENFGEAEVLGGILGEEVLRVEKDIRTSARMSIRGAQRVVTCPGRKQADGASGRRRDGNYSFVDADPVDIRLSVLMLNHVALTGVSGEVLTMIGKRTMDGSPFATTLFLTHVNGGSGYLPDDAAYEQISYEIAVTKVKPGCAEDAIVTGLLDLMDGL